MRGLAALVVGLAVLGSACTEDPGGRPPLRSPEGSPRCETRPGQIPEGFTLRGTRDIRQGGTVAVREEYRDAEGRLLVYLLGVAGEIGEGLPLEGTPPLVAGGRARFLGRAPNWALTWNEEPPCSQMSIVGNGFEREEFVGLMEEAGVLER